jgi:hypothetical protein
MSNVADIDTCRYKVLDTFIYISMCRTVIWLDAAQMKFTIDECIITTASNIRLNCGIVCVALYHRRLATDEDHAATRSTYIFVYAACSPHDILDSKPCSITASQMLCR